ncbi:MAG: hypothetical protein PHV17_04575 [Candidatus Omnitrophica bacterium]|nr:hypothetical protein [Candidatus Omnitrophota bacterium]
MLVTNLLIILAFTLLPVYLFRKSLKEVLAVFFALCGFIIIHKSFFQGLSGTYHDTFWGVETFFQFIRQWVNNGIYPGWNPYLNGGEPVYLFTNFFLKAPFVFFAFLGKYIPYDTHTLFNHCWLFLFLNFFVGSLLFFTAIFDDFRVSFFCFISLLFGGIFYVNLGQPMAVVIFILPYILFLLVTAVKHKNPYGLALAIAYLGVSLNYHIPFFLGFVLVVLFIFTVLIKPKILVVLTAMIRKHYKLLAFAVIVAILAALPAIIFNFERGNYVCPTRGSISAGGAVTIDDVGRQFRVSASFPGYRILLNRMLFGVGDLWFHHAFYFGIIPILLIPFAITRRDDFLPWIFLLAAVFLAVLSTADKTLLSFLYRYIPGFTMIRHTFPFAQFVSFFLVTVSGFGLRYLIDFKIAWNKLVISRIIVFALFLILVSGDIVAAMWISIFSIEIIFILIYFRPRKDQLGYRNYILIVLLLLLCLDLSFFNRQMLAFTLKNQRLAEPKAFSYPLKRKFKSTKITPIPVNTYPVGEKEASFTTDPEGFVFFRNSRLNDMFDNLDQTKGEDIFGFESDSFVFSSQPVILTAETADKAYIDEIYKATPKFKLSQLGGNKVFFRDKDCAFSAKPLVSDSLADFTISFSNHNSDPNRISLLIRTDTGGFLVRFENFHNGWRAFLNGRKIPIYRADYAFQAVEIQPGNSFLEFVFSRNYSRTVAIYLLLVVSLWLSFNCYLYRLD